MQAVILLYVSGDMFYFEDNNFSPEQKKALETLALCAPKNIFETKTNQEDRICSWFVDAAKEKLGIVLNQVKISLIIRLQRRSDA